MAIVPASAPKLSEARVRDLLADVLQDDKCAILGVRAYRRDTIGTPGENDVGVYDDAMFFVAPGVFIPVNANTDPSQLGWNRAINKRFAMLLPGLWYFIRGPHKGKIPALRQATDEEARQHGIPNDGEFKVWRARNMADVLSGTAEVDEGYHAINIHSGGDTTTSSWGCQTIPPADFLHFMEAVWAHTQRHGQRRIPYLLIDGPVV